MTELTDEAVTALLAHYDLPTDCDCDGDDCVKCSHYPTFQERASKQLKDAAPDLARALLDARAELAAAQQREAALSDPICVHVNMLRGTIAKPTLEQIIHLYGVDALCKALMPVIVREAEAAIIRKGGTL